MASLRPVLGILLSTLWFFALVNAAAINSLIYDNKLANANDLGNRSESFVAPSTPTTPSSSNRARRTLDTESSSVKSCHSTTPCGWALYVPFTRRVDYFMKNTCQCPTALKCIRTDDDLSVSAYVYRCRGNVTVTDIESPYESSSTF